MLKVCKKCGSVKFYGFGRSRTCKTCQIRRSSAWHIKNPEKTKAAKDKYTANNPSKIKTSKMVYIANNIEKVKARDRKYHADNREANRRNVQNRRARKRENGGVLSKEIVKSLFKLQRGKCACCGKPLGDNYHLDHRMPLALGGANEDWNMQLLTQRCNNQKGAKHPIDFMQQRGFLL